MPESSHGTAFRSQSTALSTMGWAEMPAVMYSAPKTNVQEKLLNSDALAIVSSNATYSSPNVDCNLATIVQVSQAVVLELE